jgi:hypothetical protein
MYAKCVVLPLLASADMPSEKFVSDDSSLAHCMLNAKNKTKTLSRCDRAYVAVSSLQQSV